MLAHDSYRAAPTNRPVKVTGTAATVNVQQGASLLPVQSPTELNRLVKPIVLFDPVTSASF